MKKFLTLLLAFMTLALPLLTACGGDEEASSTAVSTAQSNPGSEAGKEFPLEEKKFDTTVTILTRKQRYSQQFVPNDEYEGSVINTAVLARNQLIEEKYGITLAVKEVDRPANEIGTYISTNMDDYDIVCDAVYSMTPKVVENYFYSLNDLLELNRPWWDQNANNLLTLSDKVFFVAGNAIFTDDLMTAGVYYNKDIYADQYEASYGSIYTLVDEGKWTYDLMYEMAQKFGRADENGEWMTEGAYYGILTDGYTGATMLTNGSGTVTAYKDTQGNIVLNAGSEASVKAFDKVFNILNDKNTSLFVEQLTIDNKWGFVSNMFISGHGLFQIGYINGLLGIMENESEDKVNPGIVPIPKFDQAQTDYHCGINVYQSDVLAIPVTNNKNLEATCYAMELLGYYSSPDSQFGDGSVTTSFYETTLKLQSVTDDNDSRMLDLITNSRIYDLGGAFDWGGNGILIGIYSKNLYAGANTLASNWDSVRGAVELAMNDTIDAYQNSIN